MEETISIDVYELSHYLAMRGYNFSNKKEFMLALYRYHKDKAAKWNKAVIVAEYECDVCRRHDAIRKAIEHEWAAHYAIDAYKRMK